MKNFLLITFLLFVAIILFILLLTKTTKKSEAPKPKFTTLADKNVKKSINKSIEFLKSKYDKTYLFRDPYLMCVEQAKGCESHWRVIFHAQRLVYDSYEDDVVQPLVEIFQRAKQIEEAEYRQFRNKPMKGNYPEIYCNFAYGHTENNFMINQIISEYSEELKGWVNMKKYSPLWQWRKIWDESWCVLALAKAQTAENIISEVLQNHYNIYQNSLKNAKNPWKYRVSLLEEIMRLVNISYKLDDIYLDFVRQYYQDLKQDVEKRIKNYHLSALILLEIIKTFSFLLPDDNKDKLAQECLLALVNAIDENGMIPISLEKNQVSPTQYSTYGTLLTLQALNILFYFQKT
jgi:hypothetical protein